MVAQYLNGEGTKGRGSHRDKASLAHCCRQSNGGKNKQFLHREEQDDQTHVQADAQNGEAGTAGQTSTTRQRGGEQEAEKRAQLAD